MPRGGPRPNSGGKRPGAGRKPDIVANQMREIAKAIVLQGDTPLEVLIASMKHYRDQGQIKEAVTVAGIAAPYCHARYAAVVVTNATKKEIVLARLGSGQSVEDL